MRRRSPRSGKSAYSGEETNCSHTICLGLPWRHRQTLNSIEPPWYGPVCPVVWEGRSREAYPDQCPLLPSSLLNGGDLAQPRSGNATFGRFRCETTSLLVDSGDVRWSNDLLISSPRRFEKHLTPKLGR